MSQPRPPAFVRQSSSSLTAASLPGLGSFSQRSTPAATPPPPGMDGGFRAIQPVIYTAVYSGVPVYEMTVNNVAVMRRRDDSWLNATQILKVAGVDKGKRTKVLEKEILVGEHEKVQGGYGKYQGTWINFQRGREFCRAYGVEELLAPLLDLETAEGHDATPTKEQAMAAKRKRMYQPNLNQTNGQNGALFQPMSSTVTNAFTALSKASQRTESPGPRGGYSSQVAASSQNTQWETQEARPPPSLASESSFPLSQQTIPDSTYGTQSQLFDSQIDGLEPPRKRPRGATPTNYYYADYPDGHSRPLAPVDPKTVPDADNVKNTLMNVFINPDSDAMTALEGLTEEQVDIPLDSLGNTAIHWAASLARVPLIRALISRGASIFRVNDAGETALVRGCFCTNNFDTSSFPQLLNLLHPTIAVPDKGGRTILHHIALKSGMKGRSADGRYYLHCLLEFIAKHGATSNKPGAAGSTSKVMNLGRFITDIVNAQDKSGDTALNIAARIGNKSIVQPLLEVGADCTIPNRAGLKPLDFGIGGEPVPVQRGREQNWTVPQAVVQKREDIVQSMQNLITDLEKDFQSELSQKQTRCSTTLNNLREVTLKLGKEREATNKLRQCAREHSELQQHCRNLRRAIEEEKERLAVVEKAWKQFSSSDPSSSTSSTPAPPSSLSPPPANFPLPPHLPPPASTITLTPHLRTLLTALPTPAPHVLALRRNNNALTDKAARLHERSTELEEKFRRVVALCTGVKEERVDGLLEGLVQAVESDPGEVDTVRVRV
ncbi:apses-domain-containing protein [Ascodesmis nigricans]|uniref:Apses-domain-containing protein n=1 Tax=Ascodesmis nigricans TaxID=341454 RepID=A0A4S2MNG1_9PEZI|nr:apses-domain-containing protein [Ascodesmis nigricans]